MKDRTGERFGNLVVLGHGRVDKLISSNGYKYNRNYYLCACDCGVELEVVSNSLTSGNTKSCGCLRSRMLIAKGENLLNHKFGRLTVVSKKDGIGSYWNCVCECGGTTTTNSQTLKEGKSKSCGCLQKEASSETFTIYNREYRLSKGADPNTPMEEERKFLRGKFNILRKEIFTRDSYTCAWCSVVGSKLNVHHIETWALALELRFEESNLMTLCISCHKEAHKGNFNARPDEITSILLQGYTKVIGDYQDKENLTYDLF